uniref:Vesicle-trafficking protein SEC22b n=1 Tax=Theileria annulata TaxID=5874 RepID=A0A3B0N2X1_THEAN
MADIVVLCRSSDGLPLVEIWNDRNFDTSVNNQNTKKVDFQTIKMNSRMICRRVGSTDSKCSVIEGDMSYHYIVEDGVCYMCIAPSNHPKKILFLFLAQICKAFTEEVLNQFGNQHTSVTSAVASVKKPYHFIGFDRVIYKIKNELNSPNSLKSLNMINDSLNEVTNIMKKNIDEILSRGENLEDIGRMADGLKQQTLKFRLSSKKLNRNYLIRKFSMMAIGILIIVLFLYFVLFKSNKKIK